jgi:hypothetical protein
MPQDRKLSPKETTINLLKNKTCDFCWWNCKKYPASTCSKWVYWLPNSANNTAIGYTALTNVSTGDMNVAIGYSTLHDQKT